MSDLGWLELYFDGLAEDDPGYEEVEREIDNDLFYSRIPEATREMCRMRAGGHTLEEIAEQVGVSRSTVDRWVRRAGEARR